MSVIATQAELDAAAQWCAGAFGPTVGPGFPLSFRYGDRLSSELLSGWTTDWTSAPGQDGATRSVISLSDPETGLQCRCEITTYDAYPAVEWVAYLKNAGDVATPIIEGIRPLDALLPVAKEVPATLHHANGSLCRMDDFAPLLTPIKPGGLTGIGPSSGRSSSGALPFFNLELKDGGVIGAVGWTGGWRATFERNDSGIRVGAGMRETHLRLYPGEEIRTPRILLLFWQGERVRAHNLLRRFILAYHTPRPDGELLKVPISDVVWGERPEEVHLRKIRWLADNRIPVDHLWIDAGWYGEREHFNPQSDTFGIEWAVSVGNWWPLKAAYPNGLGPIGAACRANHLGFVLWFEAERAYEGTRVSKEHPEWLMGPHKGWLPGKDYMLNLGHPEARRYITDTVSNMIVESGITCYRQDFNFNPDVFWKTADAADRVGMSEIRHIEGLYAFWDELLARHPGLIIDNCAGGGQRIDLETISRSVPLWRSDIQCYPGFDPVAMQTQTQGLALWVPLSAGCCDQPTAYALRSALGPGLVVGWSDRELELHRNLPLDLVRKLMAEELAMRKYFYGDFYPLLSFSLANDMWAAWQWDRPDLGEGIVVALRRPDSPFPLMQPQLHGLEPDAGYEWCNVDTGASLRVSGEELLSRGVCVEIAERPGSALFAYRKLP
jgi:alpha-galactosidase